MQNLRKMGALLGAGAVMITLAGCPSNNDAGNTSTGSDLANAAANNTDAAGNAVANAGEAAANGAANAGAAVANGAANAGAAASNAAANVGAAASNATLTPQIKTALAGNKALNGSDINVDTNLGTKTVTLTGTVKSNAQKTLAASIAKQRANGYNVTNNLTVKAK